MDSNSKSATIIVRLRADSGFESDTECRISPAQWGQISAVLAENGSFIPPVPDDVWEALQRLIENAAIMGPASGEAASIVANWRGQFVKARDDQIGRNLSAPSLNAAK